MRNKATLVITRASVIAALYAAVTILFAFSSFATATLQVRISEALTLLPLFFPEACIGLYVGCILGNVIGGNALDIVVGSFATLIASLVCLAARLIRFAPVKITVGAIATILSNAFIVPLSFTVFAGVPEIYPVQVGWVALGELIAVTCFAVPVAIYLERKNVKKKGQSEQNGGETELAGAN